MCTKSVKIVHKIWSYQKKVVILCTKNIQDHDKTYNTTHFHMVHHREC